ncbi:dde superfamily endonuclease [Holotrichia oblita]|uniref:Dde superfamily endonuclease n=1 Tax=Holotrichia oblita TaxID=644536 RepID=A0ACB9TGB9_HOLOL|nr:dde superfamily endonuclease [Holotrichia oblita]
MYAAKGRKQVGALSSVECGQHVTVVCAMNAMLTHERCTSRRAYISPKKKGLEALEFAKENDIIIVYFPAHCSHHVQPLDVGFFRPLHTYYDQEIELWLRQNPDVFEDWQFSPSLTTERQLPNDPCENQENQLQRSESDQQPRPSNQNSSSSAVLDISIKDICPPPTAAADTADQRRGRKRGKAGYLNATPKMKELREKVAGKSS